MLTADDIGILRGLLTSSSLTASTADALDAKLAAMLPPPPAPQPRCVRCGRQQDDPQNINCDMAPCTFAL